MNNWTRFKDSYFLYSFKREPVAYISFALFFIFVLVALLAPVLSPYDPYDAMTIDIMDSEIPPSWMDEGDERFFMGTDVQGRDLVSAMLYGLTLQRNLS